MISPAVQQVIARIPQWVNAKEISVEPIGGLTNTNYRLSVDGGVFALRISGENSAWLGIDRQNELECLQTASDAGIGAHVEHFLLPEGHLITRFIHGRHWTVEEYRQPHTLVKVVETVKRMHALPAVRATFSPFQRVEAYIQKARDLQVPFPPDFDFFTTAMQQIHVAQQADPSPWLGFCHNDLFSVNFLYDGSVRIIDWEFAGMGDIYYDLATLVYAYDSDGPLTPELEELILQTYFGAVTQPRRERMRGMKFMLLLFTALWGLVQHGAQRAGIAPPMENFDPLEYAADTFQSIRLLS